MKKIFCTGISILLCASFLQAQNVGIGTNNPDRARFEVNGAIGNTTAIFGGETTGISLQSNFPTIGFNQYYNTGHRYIANGYAAHQFFDPLLGYMAFDIFYPGQANAIAQSSTRLLALTATGDMIVGEGSSRLSINSLPGGDARHNAILQIKQSIGSNNTGISLSDMTDNVTWKLSSKNTDAGVLSLGLNNNNVGYFIANGDYLTYSDRRLKKDIQQLPSVLDKLMQLQPVQYRMKYNNASEKMSIGFIAQDVKQVFPELVQVHADSSFTGENRDIHAVNYKGFSILAIKAIQELKEENDVLKKQLHDLEAKLGARLEILERKVGK